MADESRTYEQAIAGAPGIDFYPNEKCDVCGGMMWFDGRRYQQYHDTSKHGPVPKLTVTEAGRAVELEAKIDSRAKSVRRTMGERDE